MQQALIYTHYLLQATNELNDYILILSTDYLMEIYNVWGYDDLLLTEVIIKKIRFIVDKMQSENKNYLKGLL